MRNYYLYDEIPEEYELFLYIYPYQEIIFTAKNLLGWKDGKEDTAAGPIVVRWEEEK